MPYFGEKKILHRLPEPDQAITIVGGLFDNVRVAFIEKEPANFSRVLGDTVSSGQAELIKDELAKLFAPEVTGGTVGAVDAFEDLQVTGIQELTDRHGFSTTVSGAATISARHWGHTDRRNLKFQVLLDIVGDDDKWRLADLTVVDLKENK